MAAAMMMVMMMVMMMKSFIAGRRTTGPGHSRWWRPNPTVELLIGSFSSARVAAGQTLSPDTDSFPRVLQPGFCRVVHEPSAEGASSPPSARLTTVHLGVKEGRQRKGSEGDGLGPPPPTSMSLSSLVPPAP
ncbi:hypothetical protein EYF80_056368 [Liparis tanakae]|uniref:Secreted protein n=1 Tax=Liparis tanakae TaxID=230148 RepID=A0A4Z2EY19_9TELE|nr:hypothetical protein EYF80_056368 [Liparis tanakae]